VDGLKKMSSPIEAAMVPSNDAVRRANARARLASILGLLAIALAAAFVLAFLLQAGFFAALVPNEPARPMAVENPELITSSKSTLAGYDREQQPYQVSAASGFQDKEKPNMVHLEDVAATFRKRTGETYDLTARAALYDTKSRELALAGNVEVVEKGRFTARMERARVVVDEKRLTSDTEVAVSFANGDITAGGIEISDDGKSILFLNGVKVRFVPRTQP
jgi:lipopolysaccharide export system protein LptC